MNKINKFIQVTAKGVGSLFGNTAENLQKTGEDIVTDGRDLAIDSAATGTAAVYQLGSDAVRGTIDSTKQAGETFSREHDQAKKDFEDVTFEGSRIYDKVAENAKNSYNVVADQAKKLNPMPLFTKVTEKLTEAREKVSEILEKKDKQTTALVVLTDVPASGSQKTK